MSNIRSAIVSVISDHLESGQNPIPILRDCESDFRSPPYAVVRVGSAENMFPGQADVWDFTILIAVSHDADSATPSTAASEAAQVFALLTDTPEFRSIAAGRGVVISAVETISTEMQINENHWMHVAGFRVIAS